MKDDVLLDVLFRIQDSIVALDNKATITYVNQEFADTVGFKASEMIGKNMWTLMPRAVGTIAYKEITEALVKKEIRRFEWAGVYSKRFLETTIFPSPNGVTIISRDITKRKQVEEALIETQTRFSIAKDAASLGIYEFNVKSGKVNWDARVREIWGVAPDEPVTYDTLISGIHPEDRASTQKEIERTINRSGNEKYSIEYRVINKKTSATRWVKTTGQTFFEGAQGYRIIGTIEDVTEHKKAEDALRESEERFSKAFHANPNAMAISSFDGRYVDVNNSFERLSGFFKDEVIGKTAVELNLYTHPSEREKLITQLKQNGRVSGKELTLKTKSGELLSIIISFEVITLKNELNILSTAIDITERKKAEQALKESEERFRLVAEAANVMVYETDVRTGKAKAYSGSEEVVGFKPEDVDFSVNWVSSRIHPDDVNNVLKQFAEVLKDSSHEGYTVKYRFLHKNGKYITLQDTAKAIRDSSGRVIRMIGGAVDVTKSEKDKEKIEQYSKHLEELVEKRTKQLKESERLAAIGQTAGMVGHDIRNPLQAMLSEVYLLRDCLISIPESKIKADASESLEGIEKNIAYINKIVADLQDYSRVLKPNHIDVNLYNEIVDIFQTIAFADNIEPSIDIEPSLKLKTDPVLVKRICSNLIINAIQAMPNGGKLEISANQKDGKVKICISDTGCGIPEEIKPKLFTPMLTTKAQGQGLGLAVVKRLVQTLNGAIYFESEIDKGTKFIVEIPAE